MFLMKINEGYMFIDTDGRNFCQLDYHFDATDYPKMYINIQCLSDMRPCMREFVGEKYKNLCDVLYPILAKYKMYTLWIDPDASV